MIRFLLFLLLLYVLYRLTFGPPFKIGFFGTGGVSKPEKKPLHPDAEEMVPCGACGTFISRHEAEEKGGKFYCKPACR